MPAGRQRRRVLNGAVPESRPALAVPADEQADGAAEQRAGGTGEK